MTDEQSEFDCVDFPCPHCGENRVDFLVWLDDETVQCASCGKWFQPESRDQSQTQEQ